MRARPKNSAPRMAPGLKVFDKKQVIKKHFLAYRCPNRGKTIRPCSISPIMDMVFGSTQFEERAESSFRGLAPD